MFNSSFSNRHFSSSSSLRSDSHLSNSSTVGKATFDWLIQYDVHDTLHTMGATMTFQAFSHELFREQDRLLNEFN